MAHKNDGFNENLMKVPATLNTFFIAHKCLLTSKKLYKLYKVKI